MNTDIGAIQRQRSLVQRAPGGIASAGIFADELAQRYSSRALMVSGADLALAWNQPDPVHNSYEAAGVWISPSITIQADGRFQTAIREFPERSNDAGSYSDADASALFERLFSRQARVAAFSSPGDAGSERPDAKSAGVFRPPLQTTVAERLLPRPRPLEISGPAVERPSPPSPLPVRDSGWGAPAAFTEPVRPTALPAPEIRRVADQVMREIDNRITARRERTGRR